jgi:Predicted permeases
VPKARYGLLRKHIAREFLLSFLVSFVFFFFIFFINQILLLVQKIMLKNVSISSMLNVVSLAIPQFLIYTIPFAALSASSMTLGDLSSSNELLAIQSSGISLKRVYKVLMLFALLLSLASYFVADFLQPWAAVKYQEVLSSLMRDIPTFELESNSVNKVGNIVLSVGNVDNDYIHDVVLMEEDSKGSYGKSVVADRARIELLDDRNFVYRLNLENPRILLTEGGNTNYSYIEAGKAEYYLDFSANLNSIVSITPNNLSSRDLLELVNEKKLINDGGRKQWETTRDVTEKLLLSDIQMATYSDDDSALSGIDSNYKQLQLRSSYQPDFFYQYYSAELNKKFALCLSSICLIMVSLSIATFKIKYGRLFGFGIGLILAVAYWYALFASQLLVFKVTFNAGVLLWLPNIAMSLLGLLLLFCTRKRV